MEESRAAVERTSSTLAVLLACLLAPIGIFGSPDTPRGILLGLAGTMVVCWLVHLSCYFVGLRPGKTKKS